MNLPVDDLVAFHHLQVTPVDQTASEESIILQHVLDVPAGSTEKLVLVDIEMHLPTRLGTMPRAPPVVRQVYKVVPTLVRQHVLIMTHTAGYCNWHAHDCIVFHNHHVWTQQDIGPRRIEHGAYLRIIVPPPPDIAWDIAETIRTFHEAYELFEPSVAGHIAVEIMQSQHAGTHSIVAQPIPEESDHFHAMQYNIDSKNLPDSLSNSNRSHSDDHIPEDWIIDLQRTVQHHVDTCDNDTQEVPTISVITWLLDHQTQRICRSAKIVFLNDNPAEWREDIIRTWRHWLVPDEHVFIDFVSPLPPKSDIEDHLAHLILTQRPSHESSVLIAMDFKGETPPDVLIRIAAVVPKECNTQTITRAAPLLNLHSLHRMTWVQPSLPSDDQRFITRNGQCVQVIVHKAEPLEDEAEQSSFLQQHQTKPVLNNDSDVTNIIMTDTCKGTDLQEDIDVPMTSNHPTTRLSRRPRPLHDGTEQWLWDLGSIFSEHAEREVIDGDAYLYVQTWYVDHIHHVQCDQPRPLRLDQCAVTWLEDFRFLWRDLLDMTVPFSVHVAKPRPPQNRYEGYTCHVLIEQNRPPGRAAGVLTALVHGSTARTTLQSAYSLTRFVRLDDIIETMQIQPQCEGRRCTPHRNQEMIHLVQVTELDSAFSISVQIHPAQIQLPIQPNLNPEDNDDVVLMQQTAAASSQTRRKSHLDLQQNQHVRVSVLIQMQPSSRQANVL